MRMEKSKKSGPAENRSLAPITVQGVMITITDAAFVYYSAGV